MKIASIGALLAAALLCTSGTPWTIGSAHAKDNTGAVIGGLIAGAVIGAAVASGTSHPTNIHVASPKPTPPNPWHDAFSPKQGVTCYPRQHACYNHNGSYNGNWTWKVYHR